MNCQKGSDGVPSVFGNIVGCVGDDGVGLIVDGIGVGANGTVAPTVEVSDGVGRDGGWAVAVASMVAVGVTVATVVLCAAPGVAVRNINCVAVGLGGACPSSDSTVGIMVGIDVGNGVGTGVNVARLGGSS